MNQEYLYIDKSNTYIGFNNNFQYRNRDNFGFTYGKPKDIELQIDCFKITSTKEKEYYLAGKKNFDDKFYPCPLTIGKIQISDFTVNKKSYVGGLKEETILTLVAHNDETKKTEEIELSFNYKATHKIYFLISIFNDFIESGNKFSNFDFQKFTENSIKIESIFETINNLNIDFWVDGNGTKSAWYEAIIENLPQNTYLKNILKELISKSMSFSFCHNKHISENQIVLFFDKSYDMSSITRRKKIDFLQNIDLKIRDILKFELPNIYNPKEHLFSKISK